jgi:hypothetical protein
MLQLVMLMLGLQLLPCCEHDRVSLGACEWQHNKGEECCYSQDGMENVGTSKLDIIVIVAHP